MDKDIALFCHLHYFLYRLYGPHFAAGMCHRYQYGILRYRLPDSLRVYKTLFVDRKIGHDKTAFFKKPGGVQDRVVLHPRNQDVLAFILFCEGDAPEGKIIRFSSACGKNDLSRFCIDKTGDLFSGIFNSLLCPGAVFINTEGLPNSSLK